MVTRRDVLAGAAATMAIAGAGGVRAASRAANDALGGLCRHVDPFIGTGGHGHTYPGPSVPFGMVQLGPDTDVIRWDACSGYHLDDPTLLGFSHNHLSGTGCADLMDVLVVPRTGPVILEPGSLAEPEGSYRHRFDHADERASPGYYRVLLKDSGIEAELTSTCRVGLHRYRFSAGAQTPHLIVDMRHAARDANNPDVEPNITDVVLRVAGPDLLVGSRRVHIWGVGRVIHFAMRLSRPFAGATLYSNDEPVAAGTRELRGADLKAVLAFPDAASAPLLVKVALSGVDIEGALRNLDAELPGWDFDAVQTAARAQWEKELARVRIDGASESDARTFYTSYYHTMMAPTIFSDVDGRYRGMDTAVHTLAKGQENYSTYSLWDTYRALHPFFSLVQPARNETLVSGLVRMAQESPFGPPIWPLQGIETRCMIGWHSAVVIAEAYAKGAKGVDYAAAWPIFRKKAFQERGVQLEWYRTKGYIPSDLAGEAASKTLEIAYDDWAMAKIAEAAGDTASADILRKRSRNYANLFDKSMNFIRPRLSDGKWAEPFDPRFIGHDVARWRDFTESNAWEATFLNQHDIYHYMEMFGGEAAFEAKLDTLFAETAMPPGMPVDMTGLVGQYSQGNEPSHHIAFLYNYTGSAHKTQARVRSLVRQWYADKPDGLAGNEDCGQMSAWYLMSALGLYAVDPVSANYVLASPLFARATLDVGEGRTLVIEAPGTSDTNMYIQSVSWNGTPWTKSWISHAELAKGGRLSLQMGPKPNPAFGKAKADRPPSYTDA